MHWFPPPARVDRGSSIDVRQCRRLQSNPVAKPKTNPIREERRKVLGDWTAFCLACGWAQRWFEETEADLPAACPDCGGAMRHRCPACEAPFSSTFATECE